MALRLSEDKIIHVFLYAVNGHIFCKLGTILVNLIIITEIMNEMHMINNFHNVLEESVLYKNNTWVFYFFQHSMLPWLKFP